MEPDATMPHAAAEAEGRTEVPERSPFSRRAFLRTGTLGAITAGVIGVPGLSGLLGEASTAAPEVTGTASEAETVVPAISGPIVAHVIDAASGDVSLYIGEREVVARDPLLVERLLRAAR